MSFFPIRCPPTLFLTIALVVPLCGCLVGPDYVRTPTATPDQWHQKLEQGEYVGSQELGAWWMMFEDPILNELIIYADESNLDLYAALTRIWQARAQLCIARSALLGSTAGMGRYENNRISRNAFGFGQVPGFDNTFDFWDLNLNASWEIDVFGGIRRQVRASRANLQASVEAYRDVMVALHGDVAAAYVTTRQLQKQIYITRQNALIQQRALELAQRRVEGGVAPVLDQHQAEASLASTQALIPPLESGLHVTMNALAVQLGEYPGVLHELLAEVKPIPKPPARLPITLPWDMIRQRPDIRQAERLVAARTNEVGVAIADLYPKFTINGDFGLSAQNFSDLFASDSWRFNTGPAFQWNLLQGGRLRCNILLQEAEVEEAIVNYQATILRAAREVEDAIISYNKELERLRSLKEAVQAAERSLASVLELYKAGKTDFNNVLTSLTALVASQNEEAISEGQVILNLVALYRALGGGWDPMHHCRDRCVRVPYPQRGDAEVIEKFPVKNVADQYFEPSAEPLQTPPPIRLPSQPGQGRTPRPGEEPGREELPAGKPGEPSEGSAFYGRTLESLGQSKRPAPRKTRDDGRQSFTAKTPANTPNLQPAPPTDATGSRRVKSTRPADQPQAMVVKPKPSVVNPKPLVVKPQAPADKREPLPVKPEALVVKPAPSDGPGPAVGPPAPKPRPTDIDSEPPATFAPPADDQSFYSRQLRALRQPSGGGAKKEPAAAQPDSATQRGSSAQPDSSDDLSFYERNLRRLQLSRP